VTHSRSDLMVERVAGALENSAFSDVDRARLTDLARRVMAARNPRYADEHHPALLHPLRALLLVLETASPDPRACAVALACDTVEGEIAGDPEEEVAAALAPLVTSDGETDVEALVTAPAWVLHGWLAARLDHARHLHMWAGPERTAAEFASASEVEAPLARRAGGRLERAWADWLGKAGRYRLASRADSWAPADVRPH
jgi:hypothetical protein